MSQQPPLRFVEVLLCLAVFGVMTFNVARTEAALEVVDPSSLCERFTSPSEIQKCEKFVETKKPDTYIASSCQALDDDKLFMSCLEFATKAEVDPRALENCGGDKLSDQERWSCLQKTASRPTSSKFQRMPAQISDKHPSHRPKR